MSMPLVDPFGKSLLIVEIESKTKFPFVLYIGLNLLLFAHGFEDWNLPNKEVS